MDIPEQFPSKYLYSLQNMKLISINKMKNISIRYSYLSLSELFCCNFENMSFNLLLLLFDDMIHSVSINFYVLILAL